MTKPKTKFTKVIINVPENLLADFDIATERKNYSRSEGIKEAMRLFIESLMGEDWVPPRLLEQSKEEQAALWGGMMKGMVEAGQQAEQKLAPQQLPLKSGISNTRNKLLDKIDEMPPSTKSKNSKHKTKKRVTRKKNTKN